MYIFHETCITLFPQIFSNYTHKSLGFVECCEAQKESKSESELDEMWWKMAGELVAKYYAARDEVEKDVEGGIPIYSYGRTVHDFGHAAMYRLSSLPNLKMANYVLKCFKIWASLNLYLQHLRSTMYIKEFKIFDLFFGGS